MKALLSKAAGGPETLVIEDMPDPEPGEGQIRVAVRACGVNFPDTLIIEDKYQMRPPRPFSPGGEIAGTVDAVGPGVTSCKAGDRVLGWTGYGGMAEKILVKEGWFFKIPDAMPFTEAAAFMMTYGTSHHALKDRAKLKAGETLLVLGAAGGVGIAAVEIGKAFGARVVAAVSSQEKADLAAAHGADETVIYPRGPFDADGRKALSKAFKEAVGKAGADVIYDPVGGDYCEPALRAIAWEGRYLVIGFTAGIPAPPLNLTLLNGSSIMGVFWGSFAARNPKANFENIAELMDLYSQGQLKPAISETFTLAQGAQAIAALGERRAHGKLVVTMDS